MQEVRSANRGAFSLVEVLVCLALLGAVLIPLWTLITGGRNTAVSSRLALLAAHAAREEIEDTRVLAHAHAGSPTEISHDWQPLPATTLARLGPLSRAAGDLPVRYPDEYRRIFTRLQVKSGPDSRIFPAELELRWQELGEDVAVASAHGRTARFTFLVTGRAAR